jgi:hypothetical protein
MSGQPPNPELDEALIELHQYLSDAVAPLIVADSVQLLMKYPPEVVANAIRAWTGAQYRRGAAAAVPVSDYLYHTLKKIHMMAEFNLVPREPLEVYLAGLRPLILALCPQEDRAMLLENLGRLGEAPASISQAQNIFRQAPTEGSGPRASASAAGGGGASVAGGGGSSSGDVVAVSDKAARGLHRFSLLLERLEAQGGLAGGGAPAPTGSGVPAPSLLPSAGANEALVFAARSSQSGTELEAYLARLKAMGLEAGTDNIFRALAQTLPGWVMPTLPAAPGAAPAPAPETGALGAMRRIITDAEDPVETGRRFQQMVKAGIERFNEGSLPQAVSMLELAERLTTQKRVDAGTVELVRRKLGETLDGDQLKKFTEKPEQHAQLRQVLQFFTQTRPEGLLEELPREQKRDRRRLILALLEVHGAPTRSAAFEALSRVPGTAVGEEEWFYRRNLVYLLRRIPRTPEASFEDESDVVLRHAQLGLPLLLVKESVATLAQYKDERAEQGLTQLLFELEAMLGQQEKAPYEPKDLRALLDRVAATLGKLPAPRARRALIEHAGKKQPLLGDTMARIAELSGQDMSEDTETVDQLLALLKANLPFKLLGMTLRQNDQSLVRVIEALSGTPSAAVRRALEEVVSRFAGQDTGKAAAKALAGFDKPKPAAAGAPAAAAAAAPAPSLQGDLDVFGLPALLQSLAESSASGTLTLRGPKGGAVFGTVTLREGKLQEIERGHLRNEDAFYQLFERPVQGQFAFVKGSPPESETSLREILPLTLEAMRRYDELQEATVLVPDTVFLERTDVRPTPHPSEKDGSLLQALWERATQGGTPLDFEATVASDSYRIRRALAHWVEEGALKIRAAEAAAGPS